ncbi:MAG: hydroxyacid dehydrogenase, partial [Rhizobiales bacterium 35-66-30]
MSRANDTHAALLARLSQIVGPAGLITGEADMELYAIDWRRQFPGKPLCVVRPSSTAEVSQIVRACAEAGAAIVPQGGNTGLAAGAVPDNSGAQVVLSLTRMNAVRALDPIGMTLEADAGCILKVAQDAAADAGRLLPVSLAAEGSATIGG